LLVVVVGVAGVGGIGIGIGSEAARRDFFDERLGLIELCKEKNSNPPPFFPKYRYRLYCVGCGEGVSLSWDNSEQGQSVIGGRGCSVFDLCGLLLRLT
jgi:hypothetical protein